MSLANWTTRLLAGNTQGDDKETVLRRIDPALDAPPPADEAPSLVGTRIGAYLITKRLGAGGVGEVFKGVDTMLKRDVAIKVLRDELAADPHFLARFRNEAQLQAKLSHANVASVHAFVQEGDKQFLVMEYVPGVALDEFVRAGGPVPVERALAIFRRALDGVDHAHGHGIVHRDIKPANIMLADSGQVKVMDFGIARAMDSQEHLTRIGHVAGTAKAMSPEQIRGQQADVRSDIYSLGIVLYTLLAGRAPFDDGNDLQLMKAQLEQTPPPLRGLVDNLPPKVEAAVMKALEKDPSARFQTVRDFARAIDACLAALTTMPPPLTGERAGSPTTARTAINPVLQGAKRLPAAPGAGPDAAAARHGWPRWAQAGAVSLAVAALAGGGWLIWSAFAPAAPAAAPEPVAAAVPPLPIAPATPGVDPAPGDAQALPQPAAAPAPSASAPSAEPPVEARPPATPDPAAATATAAAAPVGPLPTGAPPAAAESPLPAVPRATLAIVHLPAGGKPAAAPLAAGSDAEYQFQPGEPIRLRVTPSQDAHVYCYLQDETQRILRFYPNRFRKNSLVKAGAALEIPGKMRFELVANSLKVPETIACFASPRDVIAELPPAVTGTDFAPLPVVSLEDVKSAFARLTGDTLAQANLHVQFK